MYALVDCNAFYANCERVFRPDLRCKPLVVLSNNDGCIVAQSAEVKRLNIPSFVPYFQVKQQLQKHGAIAFSSNYELYADLSMRVMHTLERFCRAISVYSIDEAFLDLSGEKQLLNTGFAIKQAVLQEVKLPVCVGIARTKTQAKLANHIAKKSVRCQGVCLIEDINDWRAVLRKIPTHAIWGIGSRTNKKLAALGIFSVDDFMRAQSANLRRLFGVTIERTHRELHGVPCISFNDDIETPKQIYRSRSFGQKTSSLLELRAALATHTNNALAKARKHNLLIRQLLIFIQTSRYAHHAYHNHACHTFDTPTQDISKLLGAGRGLLEHIYKPDYPYYKVGVGLIELVKEKHIQHDLFNRGDSATVLKLAELMERCQQRGFDLRIAQHFHQQQRWKMQRHHQSPRYTTRWEDIPVVKLG